MKKSLKELLFFIVTLFSFQNSFAQNVRIDVNHKAFFSASTDRLIGVKNSKVYVLDATTYTLKEKYKLEVFDEQQDKFISKKKIKFPKYKRIKGLDKIKDPGLSVYLIQHKLIGIFNSNEGYKLGELNDEGEWIGTPVTLDPKHEFHDKKLTFTYTDDENYLLIGLVKYHDNAPKGASDLERYLASTATARYTVYDLDFKEVKSVETKISSPTFVARTDADANIHILTTQLSEEDIESVTVITHSRIEDKIYKTKVPLGPEYDNYKMLRVIMEVNSEGDICLAGTFKRSRKGKNYLAGYFMAKVSGFDHSLQFSNPIFFDPKLATFTEVDYKEEYGFDPEEVLPGYLFFDDQDNLIATGEFITREGDDIKEFNGMYLLKIDKEGKLAWTTPVATKQNRQFASHKLFPADGDYYILYSDHFANLKEERTDLNDLKRVTNSNDAQVVSTQVSASGELGRTKLVGGLGEGRKQIVYLAFNANSGQLKFYDAYETSKGYYVIAKNIDTRLNYDFELYRVIVE